MFKKMDVPGDRMPKAEHDDNKSKAVEINNTTENVKADIESAEAPTQAPDRSPAQKK